MLPAVLYNVCVRSRDRYKFTTVIHFDIITPCFCLIISEN
jgi:hypothetical protein